MACMMLNGGQVYADESATKVGLKRVIRSMRWADLEAVADALDYLRRQPLPRETEPPEISKRSLTADDLSTWANA